VARLNGSQPQGVSVVGPRRIGKSSLLHYLYQPRADEVLRPRNNLHVFYLDAQQGECHTPDEFCTALVKLMLAQATIDRRTTHGRRLAELQSDLATHNQCDWGMAREVINLVAFHPVICLDEFETLLKGGFENRFFDGLRSWANEGLVTWITASAQPLSQLAHEHNLTSPFFNLLATIPLGELTEVEGDKLLQRDLVEEVDGGIRFEVELVRRWWASQL